MPVGLPQAINAKEGLAEEPGGEQRTGHSTCSDEEKPQLGEGRKDRAQAHLGLGDEIHLNFT